MSERFNRFNYELERHLNEDFPESLIKAITTTASTFDLELQDVIPLLGDNFKEQLFEEYHIKSDAEVEGLF